MSAVSKTSLKKNNKLDPKAGFYDKRKPNATETNHKEKQAEQMLTIISCLHALQTKSNNGLGILKVIRGLVFYLDKKGGASEKLLNQLNKCGLSMSPKGLREILHKVSENIDPDSIRSGFDDKVTAPVLLFTFDNADYHHYSRVVSMIVAGTVKMGTESRELTTQMNDKYISGLPKPDEEKDMNNILPSLEDDERAQESISFQNISALYNAFLCNDILNEGDKSVDEKGSESNDITTDFLVGAKVIFTLRHKQWKGQVIDLDGKKRTISYEEINGDCEEIDLDVNNLVLDNDGDKTSSDEDNPMSDISDGAQSLDGPEEVSMASDDSLMTPDLTNDECCHLSLEEEKLKMSNFVSGVNDNGRRQKIDPATTVITDVMSGVSSKHAESTRTVMERQMQKDPDFKKKVHNISTDQEFITSLFRQLFMSQHTGDKLPYIVGLA